MSSIHSVIIHGGHAHKDEFLALGIALSAEMIIGDTPVYRRDPTESELDDPSVLVLDVGRRYDHKTHNYDHHQLPAGTEECAMSLLAKHVLLPHPQEHGLMGVTYHELFKEQPWYRATVILDSRGPFELAKRIGIEKTPIELLSPIEKSLFEYMEYWKDEHPVPLHILQTARLVVNMRMEAAIKLRKRHQELEETAKFISIKNLDKPEGGFSAIWFEGDDFGIQAFREMNNLNFVVSVFKAERSPGWGLFRFDDDPRINFAQLDGDERVSFAHKGGFYAETHELLDREQIIELLSKAMTS